MLVVTFKSVALHPPTGGGGREEERGEQAERGHGRHCTRGQHAVK